MIGQKHIQVIQVENVEIRHSPQPLIITDTAIIIDKPKLYCHIPQKQAQGKERTWLAKDQAKIMAQAMASMAGSLQVSGSTRLHAKRVSSVTRAGFTVRAQHQQEQVNGDAQSSRRTVLSLVAAGLATGSFVQAVLADAKSIKVGPPPPPSGGLPGTLNSDEARDLGLPLKDRFFLQPLSPSEAAQRAKESAKEIVAVKSLIEKKAWPYVQNDLRLRAEYLRFDLNTVIAAKSKDEKKSLKELTGKLYENISNLDHAAKIKSSPEAEKYYAATVSTLNDVLAKLG
ncbi:oxygen-evolving enhancer protein 3-2, chloroplastic [Vigna radiata var. radiata]|uniref:16 kDa subunit of oxygen evolving system of photosystem II n=1 Tax=Vigna radiata var. radiata TaxID=3916 RepID=A0A1S3VA05_VIGRR|nr:oxygen-evolving enhancer protein 3-2, chloroplastic [Vigna radiata var. radiata]